MADELKASPQEPITGALAKALGWMAHPTVDGHEIKPHLNLPSLLLPLESGAKFFENRSYGKPWTTGAGGLGGTQNLAPDVRDFSLDVAPYAPDMARLAGKGAKAIGKGVGEAMSQFAPSGSGPKTLASQVGAIKPKGGNWFKDEVERGLGGLKSDTSKGTPAQMVEFIERKLKDLNISEDGKNLLRQQLPQYQKESAINNWVDKNLTNYVKNQMGTPEDPVRKLAEEGIVHKPFEDLDQYTKDDLGKFRAEQGFPPEGLGKSPEAQAWENESDLSLNAKKAKILQELPEKLAQAEIARKEAEQAKINLDAKLTKHLESKLTGVTDQQIKNIVNGMGFTEKERMIGDDSVTKAYEKLQKLQSFDDEYNLKRLENNPWINKVAPDTNIYSAQTGVLGFDHILDVLKEDVANGRLHHDNLKNVSMEQAVRRTHEYDQEMAKKMAEAQFKVTEGMPIHKEYPEGYKWIELAKPDIKEMPSTHQIEPYESKLLGTMYRPVNKETRMHGEGYKTEDQATKEFLREHAENQLAEALKYEGETMGHCVGGYCPDVLAGRSRIFSLRDAKGEPHVTVETNPSGLMGWQEIKRAGGDPLSVQTEAKRRMGITPEAERELTKSWDGTERARQQALLEQNMHDIYVEQFGEPPQNIIQIKGKGNKKPVDKYLPMVQDFVKSGNWGDVGELHNTGLVEQHSLDRQIAKDQFGLNLPRFTTPQESKDYMGLDVDRYHNGAENLKIPESLLKYKTQPEPTPEVPSEVPPIAPPETPQFKSGGAVTFTDNPDAMMMEVNDRKFANGGESNVKQTPQQWIQGLANQPTEPWHPLDELTSNLQGIANLPSRMYEGAKSLYNDPMEYLKNIKAPTAEQVAMGFNPAGLETGLAGMAEKVGNLKAIDALFPNKTENMLTSAEKSALTKYKKDLDVPAVMRRELFRTTGTGDIETPSLKMRPEKGLSPDYLLDKYVVPILWDTSGTGTNVSQIAGVPLSQGLRSSTPTSVQKQGGRLYPLIEENAQQGVGGASMLPAASSKVNNLNTYSDKGPTVGVVMDMAEHGIDFSHHIAEPYIGMLNALRPSNDALKAFKQAVRETPVINPITGVKAYPYTKFPGIDSPNIREIISKGTNDYSAGNIRKAIAEVGDTYAMEKLGFPRWSDIYKAMSMPDAKTGQSAKTILEVNPNTQLITPNFEHGSYNTGMGATYAGGLADVSGNIVGVPDTILLKRLFDERLKQGKTIGNVRSSLLKSHHGQLMTAEDVARLREYLGYDKPKKAEGGEVHMAGGGKVGLAKSAVEMMEEIMAKIGQKSIQNTSKIIPKETNYVTKQDGPFYRVTPKSISTSTSSNSGARQKIWGSDATNDTTTRREFGSRDTPLFSHEGLQEVINNNAENLPRNLANKKTQEIYGKDYQELAMPDSSLVKQAPIARAFMSGANNEEGYKNAIFNAYLEQHPELIEQTGSKNYDDLLKASYEQLAKETKDQFKSLPFNFSFHQGEGTYPNSASMNADVHGNNHIYVFQGGDKHDFLNEVDPETGLNTNEMFRAVHDIFGHGIHGNQFGPKGEEIAWGAHHQMYSPLAIPAMTAETRGQNSVVNYSPLNADIKSAVSALENRIIDAKRERNFEQAEKLTATKADLLTNQFRYAPQASVLLPPEMLKPEYSGGMPDYLKDVIKPDPETKYATSLYHFSHDPNLSLTNPEKYGTGIKGQEAERLEYSNAIKPRTYFYTDENVKPEVGLGSNRYKTQAEDLYNLQADPLNFFTLAKEANRQPFTAKYNAGVTPSPQSIANDVERLAKEYGYSGVVNPSLSKPAAAVFKPMDVEPYKIGGEVHLAGGGSASKALEAMLAEAPELANTIRGLFKAEAPTLGSLVDKLRTPDRQSVLPMPNRWFLDPENHPEVQGLVQKVLDANGMNRSDFHSGAYVDPKTGKIIDTQIHNDVGVAIDPITNRPVMTTGGVSGMEQLPSNWRDVGSATKSNLVKQGKFQPVGGDPILNDIGFLSTIEKSGAGHKYGLGMEYANPTMLHNTLTGDNPTLRPQSYGDLFGIGDVVGKIQTTKTGPIHDVYEKLLVASKGSDVKGVKLNKKKGGKVTMTTNPDAMQMELHNKAFKRK